MQLDVKEELLKIIGLELLDFNKSVANNLDSTGTTKSGYSKNSLSIVKNGLSISSVARSYFTATETGRKDGGGIGKKYISNLQAWVEKVGINWDNKSSLSNAWRIAKKHQKDGSLLYRQRGRKDIFTNEIDKFIKQLIPKLENEMASILISSFDTEGYFKNQKK